MPRASGTTGAASEKPQRFRRGDRLKRRYEFRQAQLSGRRIHTPHFLIVVQPNALQNTRLGITVTKKVGREVFRRNRQLFPLSHDLVFIAKRGATEIEYASLLGELQRAATKLRPEAAR
jgi:ribonuclease P protein component